jgi:hypothetical protein
MPSVSRSTTIEINESLSNMLIIVVRDIFIVDKFLNTNDSNES